MDKQLFDDAIGEVPPSTVDVDAVIARGRRAERVRRLASPVVATAAAVTVLTGGVAVVLTSDGDTGFGTAGPPSTTRPATSTTSPVTSSPSRCADMMPTAPPGPEEPAAVVDRLTGLVHDAVRPRLAGGADLTVNPDARYPDGVQHGPLEFYHVFSGVQEIPNGCQGGEDYYLGQANVRSPGGTGSLLALVGRGGGGNGGFTTCDEENAVTPGQTYCHRQVEDGDVIVQTTMTSEKGVVTNRVDVARADGTYVLLEASNMARSGKYPGPPTADAVPLTHAQLTQIALDPGMTMYPQG